MISFSRSRGVRAGGAVAIGSVSVWTNAASLCTAMTGQDKSKAARDASTFRIGKGAKSETTDCKVVH